MKYRNIKTGQIIEVPSEISGASWEVISGKSAKETATSSTPEDQPVKRTRKSTKKD